MKFTLGKRILMFFHWLFSLLICAAFAIYIIAPDFLMRYYSMVEAAVGADNIRIIGIAILAVYAILVIIQIVLICKRRRRSDRGFITVDASDNGKVRIAITAIEQMVRQSVNSIEGITDMKINIENQDDAIGIGMNASILNGSHVPTITMNMQRAIRQFVEMNCGVAVRSVSININSVSNSQEASRGRRHGLGKGNSVQPAMPVVPVQKPEQSYNSYTEPEAEPAPATAVPSVPLQTDESPSNSETGKQTEYDLDKPYESEFAKELAAMKARDAAENAITDEDI